MSVAEPDPPEPDIRSCLATWRRTGDVHALWPDLSYETRRRALEERVSISQLVTGMIERELRIAAMNEWLRGNREASPRLDLDSAALIDDVRTLDARH